MNKTADEPLDQISDPYICEAARPGKSHGLLYSVLAAILMLVILVSTVSAPMNTGSATACIAAAVYPEHRDYSIQLEECAGRREFFIDSTREFLSGSGDENIVCSPLNIYLALALLAESSSGTSRQEILDALGCNDLDTLRTQVNQAWNTCYRDDEFGQMLPANSLWLDSGFTFDPATVATLAADYHASIYQGDLGSSAMNEMLRQWIN